MKVTKNKIGNFGMFYSKGLKYKDKKRLRNKEIIETIFYNMFIKLR